MLRQNPWAMDPSSDYAGSGGRRPVRVLWLVKGLGQGGAEQLLVNHARVGDTTGFAYQAWYVVPWKDQLVPALEARGVRCRCVSGGRAGRAWPLRVARGVRSGDFDVVHAHSPLMAVVARLARVGVPRSRRPALVSTEHNVWERYSAPTRWLNAVTCGMDDHRWAVSRPVAESTHGRAAKVTSVLEHGIVLSELQPTPDARGRVRAELGIGPDATVVTTVANFRASKDYPNLLAAARSVLRGAADVHFVSVGQGPLEPEVRALRDRLGLATHVHLLGHRTDVTDMLAASDVFCLSSLHEGLPVALMEAMAAGLPAVCTTVGGIPDVVHEGVEGWLVPPGDAAALATAITAATSDPQARQARGAAAQRASARFDARKAVGEQERTYVELSARAPTG